MPFDSFIFQGAWRRGRQVGIYRPTTVVEVQAGRFERGYKRLADGETAATIPGETARKPWRAWWSPDGPWTEIPGVASFTFNDALGDQNGMTTGSVAFDNVGMTEKVGPAGGVFHAVERGYLAPLQGYRAPGRPKLPVKKGAWYDVLTKGCRIRVWAGYGLPQRTGSGKMPDDGGPNGGWLFNGLVDDLDLDSMPATLKLILREGVNLSDQRLFGYNKSPQLNDPVTFADRLEADKVTVVGSGARASSSDPGSPARLALSRGESAWRSNPHSQPEVTEWVQIRLPKGRYTDFLLDPLYDGMECYISVYLKGQGEVDGSPASGWIGSGNVPGTHGGVPYVRRIPRVNSGLVSRELGVEVEVPDDSILRVSFRSLPERGGEYRAGVSQLRARRRARKQEIKDNKWILVDDIADVVVTVLRWAGYEEWDVERSGIRLKGKVVFNRATFLADIIKRASDDTGNVFHFADPPTGDSWGIPTWRQNAALSRPKGIIEVRDDQLLLAMNPKISKAALPYIIRVRGKEAERSAGGTALGGDKTKRIMAVYRPPWHARNRLAGIIKHEVQTIPSLRTYEECYVAGYLIAVNAALQFITATGQTLANPAIALDTQVGIVDTGTGSNTRMWVTNREISGSFGANASFKMAFGGSMIDHPDMLDLIKQLDSNRAAGNLNPGGKVRPE